ncbi:MAG TPA: hypothetical protein PLF85_07645 [Turneriella sp.]|nr:hypothetical protein [Turneriella sp.]
MPDLTRYGGVMRRHGLVCIGFLVISASLSANMRAPVRIERGYSRLLAKPSQLRLSGEKLEFDCPAAHTGKPEPTLFAQQSCAARVTYQLSSAADERVALSFVYSGSEQVEWNLGTGPQNVVSRAVQSPDRLHCTYCPDDMRSLRVAETEADIKKSLRAITVRYQQALDYDESGHGYFRAGQWTQGFSYELWPLAEWQWDTKITAKLQLTIAARPGFLGIGYRKDEISCAVLVGERQIPVALTIGEPKDGKRTATAEIELQKQPQRLRCSWSAQ